MSTPHQIVASFFAEYPTRMFKKGQIILLPDPATVPNVSLVVEGVITQYDITETGDRVVVNIFKAGAFCPVSCAINDVPNAYYFEATSDCVVQQAPPQDVLAFLQREPRVVFDLLQRVYRGVDGVLGRLTGLLGGDAGGRLLYELQICARRFGKHTAHGVQIEITEERLAQQTGLARETVSRELKKLRQREILTQQRGVIEMRKDLVV